MTEWPNSHNLKIQDGGHRHLGLLGYVKRKMSNSGLDKDICIKFYGIMHRTLAYTTTVITACTTVQAVSTSRVHGLYCGAVFTACAVEPYSRLVR